MKKHFDRLLLCGLMLCSLAMPAAFAEGEGTGNFEVEPQPAATLAPAMPDVSVTEEPTQEPASDPDAEPSPEPTAEPSQEPTPEPSPEPSVFPSATPAPDILPIPDSIEGLVNITPEGAAQQENGLWRIQLSASDSPLAFAWTVSDESESYLVCMQTGEHEMILLVETPDTQINLSSAAYTDGQHTLYVGARLANGSVTWGSITFELVAQQGGSSGGGRPGGNQPSGSASMGNMAQGEQGFHVMPGEALTSKHSSGTKNTAAYTYSEINDFAEAITVLVLDSTQTEITLDGGAAFFASKDDGELQLMPESDGACWNLNALAMNTLAESGIDRVVFNVGGTAYSMPTRMEFCGSIYASLRAKGYVSKDMEISIDALGVHISVDGCSYSINNANELVPCEE